MVLLDVLIAFVSVSNGAHILFGGFSELLLEACSKMRGIFESDIIGDFRYILMALAKQLSSPLKPVGNNKIRYRLVIGE